MQLLDIGAFTETQHIYTLKNVHQFISLHMMIYIEINAADLAQILFCYLKRDPIESL